MILETVPSNFSHIKVGAYINSVGGAKSQGGTLLLSLLIYTFPNYIMQRAVLYFKSF